MLTKFVVAFSILALATAIGGSIPTKGATYEIRVSEPATVSGTALKPGDYKVVVTPTRVTFFVNKEQIEIPAKVEEGQRKFEENQVQYEHLGSQTRIKTIGLGGTKVQLVFN